MKHNIPHPFIKLESEKCSSKVEVVVLVVLKVFPVILPGKHERVSKEQCNSQPSSQPASQRGSEMKAINHERSA